MEGKHSSLYLMLFGAPIGMIAVMFLLNFLFPHWLWNNLPVHASVEAIGGLAAISLSLFVYQKEQDDYSGQLALMATGVLSMGVLSIIHGFDVPGATFVFLYSLSILVGGIWFLITWLPNDVTHTFGSKMWVPWVIGIISTIVGTIVMIQPSLVPVMLIEEQFTVIPISMNVIGGVLFLVAVPRLMSDYIHTHRSEFLYFFSFALLFAIVGLTFSFSQLWDMNWWLWHQLRLLAYLVGLWFLAQEYVKSVEQQKQMAQKIKENRAELEQVYEDCMEDNKKQTNDLRKNQEVLQQAIDEYVVFTEKVGSGDLTVRLLSHSMAGLNRLNDNLNNMVENLGNITRQMYHATQNITVSATDILTATTQQSSTAAEQSSSIVEMTTTVEQIKSIASQTARQAEQLSKDSQQTLDMANHGTKVVENTVKGMQRIRQQVESIAQTILALSEQTQAIGAITSTVSELADQSNLLALNAAIEAARAGEQGKSFAVVAQHVRDLAERSKAATVQVQEILEQIQRATNNAVMVTEEGTKGVEMGVQLSNEAGQVIHSIAAKVEQGAQANMQMAAASHQQTSGMEQIAQAMKIIQQATVQSLDGTRQTEDVARNLHMLAQSLQDVVTRYRLNEH